MKLYLPGHLLENIRKHASGTYPEECCGFLIGRKEDGCFVDEARGAGNVAPEPRTTRYTINPLDIMHAERSASSSGRAVIGYYHSHPDHPSVPSEYDRSHAWPSYSYFIIRVQQGVPADFRSWRLSGEGGRFIQEEIEVV